MILSIARLSWAFLLLFSIMTQAGTVPSENSNLEKRPAAQIKVACIGNSVTYGYGHTDPAKTSYPAVLQNLLGSRFAVKNFGHSGATLLRKGHNPYFKTKQFKEALDFAADIAIIHLGLNDTDPRNWPAYHHEFEADYAWLIDTFRKNNPHIKIFISLLSPIFPDHRRYLSGTRDWFWKIQELIPGIAEANKVGLVDFHSPLYSRPDLFPDPLHPNEEGAALIAQTAYQRITGNYGGLQLPYVYASHMVFQRDRPIPFYGKANTGDTIMVAFNNLHKIAIADDQGNWQVKFPALKAGGPHTVILSSGSKRMTLEEIYIGEVWLCVGQSNMDFPLQSAINGNDEMLIAQNSSDLHLLNREPVVETDNQSWNTSTLQEINRLQYFKGSWQPSDSVSAKKFSAVAYYFGQQLQKRLQVPVGLIQVAVGGSTTESWIDRYAMEQDPLLVNELTNWRKSDFFMDWVKERANTNLKNSTNPKQRHPYDPAYNFESGIAEITTFPIKGVIWYQGESNTHNIELHETLFTQLVKSWRTQWGYEVPFYYVQLSSMNRETWDSFRASQLELLKKIPQSGMAVSSDLGDPKDVHPKRKKEVGERLGRLALHFTYQQKKIVPYGPMPGKAIRKKNKIVISFDYSTKKLKTANHQPLQGFELINDKGMVIQAVATIHNNKVIIPVPDGENIQAVRYGWKPYSEANMVNEEGLPASTFRLMIFNNKKSHSTKIFP